MKRYIFFLFACLCLLSPTSLSAKRVKTTLSIVKESKTKKKNSQNEKPQGREINLLDSLNLENKEIAEVMKACSFVGYDKEASSSKESFLLVNPTQNLITGYKIRIDYLDMQGRMLHSREIIEKCFVPPGETRRFDISGWDTQHTYYYHLGNEPKRVATPFKVLFSPQTYWIEE